MYPTAQVGKIMLARKAEAWDFSDMADVDDLRGKALYDALIALKPAELLEGDWASQAGVNRGWFTNLKAAPISPRSDTIRKILRVVGRTEADLYGAASGRAPTPAAAALISDRAPTRDASEGEIVQIIQLDLSLPMGPGATVDEYVEEQPLDFDLAYIRSFTRTPPERLRLARGIGESMYPTLNNMDLVWIDSTQRQLNQSDRIWAVSINGAAAIKRLRPLKGGRVLVMSDNPAIGDYEVDADELLIGGRVIRFARDV